MKSRLDDLGEIHVFSNSLGTGRPGPRSQQAWSCACRWLCSLRVSYRTLSCLPVLLSSELLRTLVMVD